MDKLIIGNWKMNPQSVKEAEILFIDINKVLKNIKKTKVVICPPFPFLSVVKNIKNKKVILGAQNVFFESNGPYTGEVSTSMLKSLDVKYVIVGHGERRALGETNEILNKKLIAIFKAKLIPILCIGEIVRSNDGSYLQVIKDQLTFCLRDIPKSYIKDIVIAYEPIWALSSTLDRHDATPRDFEEIRIYIRKILNDMFSPVIVSSVQIIYGGSVNKDNAEDFLHAGAQGLLIGKASLNARNFLKIIKIINDIK